MRSTRYVSNRKNYHHLNSFILFLILTFFFKKIPMKDFGSEIRATMDIDHLLNKAVLLLDLQETCLEEIFAKYKAVMQYAYVYINIYINIEIRHVS